LQAFCPSPNISAGCGSAVACILRLLCFFYQSVNEEGFVLNAVTFKKRNIREYAKVLHQHISKACKSLPKQ